MTDEQTVERVTFVVVSRDNNPFLLGRYQTLQAARKAVGGRPDVWEIYSLYEEDQTNEKD